MDNDTPQPRRYTARVFGLTAAFVWMVTFVILGVFYYRENVFKAEGLNADLQTRSAALLEALDHGQPAQSAADSVAALARMRVTVLDTAGCVLYDTGGVAPGTDHSDRREVQLAMRGAEGYTVSRATSSREGGEYFYSARSDGGRYIVRASLPHTPVLDGRLEGETSYVIVALMMALVLTAIAYFASRRLGHDVEDMLNTNSQRLHAEERERSQMKARLTSNINHELKNPVHALAACLETLDDRAGYLTPDQTTTLCRQARQEVQRIEALIADIGTLTRLSEAQDTPIERAPFDIAEVLEATAKYVTSLPQTHASMRLHILTPRQLPMTGNEALITSVFRNLVDNALLHSSGRDIWIRLVADTPDSYTFAVSDNGIGIPPQHRDKVFERFYRVDAGRSRQRGGTGLGLAIVKNALAVHGGTVEARERPGGGTEIVFTIKKS